MHEEDMKSLQCVEEILEKEIRQEMKKIQDAGQFAPGQTKTLTEAVDLMLKAKEYEEWLEGMGMSDRSQRNASRMSYGGSSYAPTRSHITGRFVSGDNMPGSYGWNTTTPAIVHANGYPNNYSGHSTRDRMISALEDLMGTVKNEYEAQMVMDTINYIQRGESR